MKPAALLLLMVGLASAQTIDLRGPWREMPGDNEIYARADFDDSAWGLRQLPRQARVALGVSWLRRRAVAPSGATALAVAIGAGSHCTQVYLNDKYLGGSGCRPGSDPPYFAPLVLRVPEGWLTPGSPFVIALRWEGRRNTSWAVTPVGLVEDFGPYALGPLDEMDRRASQARLLMERRVAIPLSLQASFILAAAVLLLVLWTKNRERWELLWFGLFQMAVGIVAGILVWAAHQGMAPTSYTLVLTLGYLGLNAGSRRVLTGRGLSFPWACALVVVLLLGWATLPFVAVQLLGLAMPVTWALHTLRKRDKPVDRLFGTTVLLYAFASLNAAGYRLFPEAWPLPASFSVGPFLWSAVQSMVLLQSVTSALLLVFRLGEDWRERQKLGSELEAARTVQRLFLASPAGPTHWKADALYQPALQVGGDFYQIIEQPGGALLLVAGDVSGKGMEAAMVASVAIGAFRTAWRDASPAQVLGVLNEALTGLGRTGFVTCCSARFDVDGSVRLANAGHPSPYCDGREVVIEAGLPLGVMSGVAYEETVVRGERFTFVSDGVVEAANAKEELFGFDRTRTISTRSAQEIAAAAKHWGQNDDITVVTVRRQS